MTLKYRNCPTCKTRYSAYTEAILDMAMAEHARREHPQPMPDEHPYDFSHSGLGIGGLGSFVEPPFIPTIAQMRRMEQVEAGIRACRRCGESDAMFTTDRSSGLCDDCYG